MKYVVVAVASQELLSRTLESGGDSVDWMTARDETIQVNTSKVSILLFQYQVLLASILCKRFQVEYRKKVLVSNEYFWV